MSLTEFHCYFSQAENLEQAKMKKESVKLILGNVNAEPVIANENDPLAPDLTQG